MTIYNHNIPEYRERWDNLGDDRWNGQFYYSKEICSNIIPNVETDRSWVTVNQLGYCEDGSIIFVHDNIHPVETHDWQRDYKDLVYVCSVLKTYDKIKEAYGQAILLPLSVDVKYVERFKSPKTKHIAAAGRMNKLKCFEFPKNVDLIGMLPREKLLPEIAKYRYIAAVGRTAIEAKILGCEVVSFDPRYPDPSIWEILDNKDAAAILQSELDKLD